MTTDLEADAPSPKEQLAIAQRGAQIAFANVEEINPRVLAILQNIQMLSGLGSNADYEPMVSIVADEESPERLPIPPGPLLVATSDSGNADLVSVTSLIVAPDSEIRGAALEHFKRLATSGGMLTPKTSTVLEENATSASGNKDWRPAAIAIHDAVTNDWLSNLAATNQLLAIGYWSELPRWLEKVLRPAVSSLDSINIEYWSLEEQIELEAAIAGWASESSDLSEFLDLFFSVIGHLPFDPTALQRGIARTGLLKGSEAAEVVEQVWAWVDKQPTPLASYHACQFLLVHSELRSASDNERLWQEVEEILFATLPERVESGQGEAWALRADLADHFCSYLENELPGQESGPIAGLSWWLAERVAGVLGSEPARIGDVREVTIGPVLERSKRYRAVAHPAVQPSLLRFVTLHYRSIWSFSLLPSLGEDLDAVLPKELPVETQERFTSTLVGGFMTGLQGTSSEGGDRYAFSRSLDPLVEGWMRRLEDDDAATAIEQTREFSRQLFDASRLPDLLTRLGKAEDRETQAVLVQAVRAIVYRGVDVADVVWARLEEGSWLRRILEKADIDVVEVLLDTLAEIQSRELGDWRFSIPHQIAATIDDVDSDYRAEALFGLLVFFCTASQTRSALLRLGSSRRADSCSEWAAAWIDLIADLWKNAPTFVKGRFRSVLGPLQELATSGQRVSDTAEDHSPLGH